MLDACMHLHVRTYVHVTTITRPRRDGSLSPLDLPDVGEPSPYARRALVSYSGRTLGEFDRR